MAGLTGWPEKEERAAQSPALFYPPTPLAEAAPGGDGDSGGRCPGQVAKLGVGTRHLEGSKNC